MTDEYRRSRGFTLLEMLVALTLLTTAMAIIWSSFSAGMNAWRRGGKILDGLRHGDFVADQLAAALRSSAASGEHPERFGFVLVKGTDRYPADEIQWVTAAASFVPPNAAFAGGLYRVTFGLVTGDDGQPAAAVQLRPHFVDPEDYEPSVHILSREVKGFACRVYDPEQEDWSEEWPHTNAIPPLVEFTLYMDGDDPHAPPQTLRRLVSIPLFPGSAEPEAPAARAPSPGRRRVAPR